tara:strand:- start:181 stop:789 length:609 start_codon:yes stop_codon:yes gene_type:complete
MEQNTIFLFLFTSISLTLFPGPDILYVISTSIAQGWKNSFMVSLGLCSGLIVHTLFLVLGLGSLLQAYPQLIRIIELLGAAYLIFMAFQLWNVPSKKNKYFKNNSNESFFFTGFIMNLSNPKVFLFFLSFFPGFLFSTILPYNLQFFILGIIFITQAIIIFTLSGLIANLLGQSFKSFTEQSFWNKFQALVLLMIALFLIYP